MSRRSDHELTMTRTGALLVALVAVGCVRVMMPPAVTQPLSQPDTESPMVWQYAANSITLNDCHMRGVEGPFQFDDQAIGQLQWTKTGAVQDIAGTSDVLLTDRPAT